MTTHTMDRGAAIDRALQDVLRYAGDARMNRISALSHACGRALMLRPVLENCGATPSALVLQHPDRADAYFDVMAAVDGDAFMLDPRPDAERLVDVLLGPLLPRTADAAAVLFAVLLDDLASGRADHADHADAVCGALLSRLADRQDRIIGEAA